MSNDEVYYIEREKKETWSWTQKDFEEKMSDNEAHHLEGKEKKKEAEIRRKQMEEKEKEIKVEKEKEVETRTWTQKAIERKMSGDEARHIEREEEEEKTRRKLTDEISRDEKTAGGSEDKLAGNTSIRQERRT